MACLPSVDSETMASWHDVGMILAMFKEVSLNIGYLRIADSGISNLAVM